MKIVSQSVLSDPIVLQPARHAGIRNSTRSGSAADSGLCRLPIDRERFPSQPPMSPGKRNPFPRRKPMRNSARSSSRSSGRSPLDTPSLLQTTAR